MPLPVVEAYSCRGDTEFKSNYIEAASEGYITPNSGHRKHLKETWRQAELVSELNYVESPCVTVLIKAKVNNHYDATYLTCGRNIDATVGKIHTPIGIELLPQCVPAHVSEEVATCGTVRATIEPVFSEGVATCGTARATIEPVISDKELAARRASRFPRKRQPSVSASPLPSEAMAHAQSTKEATGGVALNEQMTICTPRGYSAAMSVLQLASDRLAAQQKVAEQALLQFVRPGEQQPSAAVSKGTLSPRRDSASPTLLRKCTSSPRRGSASNAVSNDEASQSAPTTPQVSAGHPIPALLRKCTSSPRRGSASNAVSNDEASQSAPTSPLPAVGKRAAAYKRTSPRRLLRRSSVPIPSSPRGQSPSDPVSNDTTQSGPTSPLPAVEQRTARTPRRNSEQILKAAMSKRTVRLRRSSAPETPTCSLPDDQHATNPSSHLRSARRPEGRLGRTNSFGNWSFEPLETFIDPHARFALETSDLPQTGSCNASTVAGASAPPSPISPISPLWKHESGEGAEIGTCSFVDHCCKVFTATGVVDPNASSPRSQTLPAVPAGQVSKDDSEDELAKETRSTFARFCACFRPKADSRRSR